MNDSIPQVLSSNHISPVLVDVGASAKPPALWAQIAAVSTYLGFDPDSRDFQSGLQAEFAFSHKFNYAVGTSHSPEARTLHLTRSPYCSSLLEPIKEELGNYTFRDEFLVDSTRQVQTFPLAQALAEAKLDRIDWLKLDSQGLDFGIYSALPDTLKNSLLALDMEPGLVPAYQGEDLFSHSHPRLLADGFWLAGFQSKGVPRIQPETIEWLKHSSAELASVPFERLLRDSPVWCNVLYFRSIKWLERAQASKAQLITLWSFSALTQLWGFAFEILRLYQQMYFEDQDFLRMHKISLHNLNGFRGKLRRVFPARMARHLISKVWGE